MKATISELKKFIVNNDEFLLLAHISPDGDTLGSCLALLLALEKLGKRARVVCHDPVPKSYQFLPGADKVLLPSEAPAYPNVMAIDSSDIRRLGSGAELFAKAKNTANVDHHATNEQYAGINWVETEAAATGELIYELIKNLDVAIDKTIGTCLYTALMTDTGNFSYTNTSKTTFCIAAELVEVGVDLARINRRIYRTVPYGKTKLIGAAISNIALFGNDRIAIADLSLDTIHSVGAAEEDVEGIIDYLRDIETVEVAILLRETKEGVLKASFRSKEYCDVAKLASAFGGGGHKHAAGASIKGELKAVRQSLIDAAVAALGE